MDSLAIAIVIGLLAGWLGDNLQAAFELGHWFGDAAEVVEWTPADLGWRYNIEEELA